MQWPAATPNSASFLFTDTLMVISSSLLLTHRLSVAEIPPSSLERKVFFELEAAVFETIVAKGHHSTADCLHHPREEESRNKSHANPA